MLRQVLLDSRHAITVHPPGGQFIWRSFVLDRAVNITRAILNINTIKDICGMLPQIIVDKRGRLNGQRAKVAVLLNQFWQMDSKKIAGNGQIT